MTEQKSESCGCDSSSECHSKSGRLLLNFFLVVIIILLAGIFYTLQGFMSLCPAMNNAHYGAKAKTAFCPMMKQTQAPVAK